MFRALLKYSGNRLNCQAQLARRDDYHLTIIGYYTQPAQALKNQFTDCVFPELNEAMLEVWCCISISPGYYSAEPPPRKMMKAVRPLHDMLKVAPSGDQTSLYVGSHGFAMGPGWPNRSWDVQI